VEQLAEVQWPCVSLARRHDLKGTWVGGVRHPSFLLASSVVASGENRLMEKAGALDAEQFGIAVMGDLIDLALLAFRALEGEVG
jgi:hypothetical protein